MDGNPAARPGPSSFLKALCIVILSTCGVGLFLNLSEALFPPYPEAVMEMFDTTVERFGPGRDVNSVELLDRARVAQHHIVLRTAPIAALKATACVLAMIGAWLMLQLKGSGFHLYVLSGIIWSFAPMLVTGGNMVTWSTAFLYGFVCLVFTILLASRRSELN